MTSGYGPFAVRSGFRSFSEPKMVVYIHNTNIDKLSSAIFLVSEGQAVADTDFESAQYRSKDRAPFRYSVVRRT